MFAFLLTLLILDALLLSVVNLFVLPFGTMLAIYTYWVLLHDEARALFEHGTSAH